MLVSGFVIGTKCKRHADLRRNGMVLLSFPLPRVVRMGARRQRWGGAAAAEEKSRACL